MIQKRNVIVFAIFAALLFSSCTSEEKRSAIEEKLSAIYEDVSLYLREGEIQKAVDLLEKEVSFFNRDFRYYFSLGYCYFSTGNENYIREANKYFLRANILHPSNYNNAFLLATTFDEMQDIASAKIYFTSAIKSWETTDIRDGSFISEPYVSYSKILINERDFELALEYIEKSLVANENNSDALLLKGFILANVGNIDDLAVYYEKALELSPNEPILKRDYGKMLIELGEYQKAYDFFTQIKNDATLTEVDHYDATVELCYLALLNKNYNVALSYLTETGDYTFANYPPIIKYGIFYYWKINDYTTAYRLYKMYRVLAEALDSQKALEAMFVDPKSTDITEVLEYFKDDIYFKMISETKMPIL